MLGARDSRRRGPFGRGWAAGAALLLAALGLFTPGDSARATPPLVVTHRTGRIFLIEAGPPSGLARALAGAAAQAADEMEAKVGVALPPRVEVVICGDPATFSRFAGASGALVLLGVAHPGRNVAALNAPLLAPGPERGPAGVLRHELAHLALVAAAEGGGPLPRWYDEGVASWFAGGLTELGPLDFVAADNAPDLALARLTFNFPEDPAAARIAYVKSQLAITYLEAKGGPGTAAALGRALARGMPFPAALEATVGFDTEELDRALKRSAAPHGLLVAVLRRSVSPFFAMALLVVFGYVIRRHRLKARLKAWEKAEASQAEPPADEDANAP